MKRLVVLWLICGCLVSVSQADVQNINVVTEKSPFTMVSDNGVGGEAQKFVDLLITQAGMTYESTHLPWRRAYNIAASEKNTVIYPIARSQEREKDFIWLGQLIPVNYYVFKLAARTDIQASTLDEIRGYSIGVVNFHVHHEYLRQLDMPNLQPVNSNLQNIRKALLRRIDLFPLSDGGIVPLCKQRQIDCGQFMPLLKIDDISSGLWVAINRHSDPIIINALQQSFNNLVEQGNHAVIFAERLNNIKQFEAEWLKPDQIEQ